MSMAVDGKRHEFGDLNMWRLIERKQDAGRDVCLLQPS
jgi:hypothetical protein